MNKSLSYPFLNPCKQTTKLDQCQEAECLHNASHIKLIQWIELISDVIGIIAMIYLMRTRQFRKLAGIVNPNLKMIGITGLGFYFLCMIFNVIMNVYLKVILLSAIEDPCDYLWNPVSCLIFKLPVFYAFAGFNIFHVVLSLERARIIFVRSDMNDLLFGQFGVILMLVVPSLFVGWSVSKSDLVTLRPYCFIGRRNEVVDYGLIISGIILIVSDITTTVLDVVVYFFNKRQLKSKMRGYELSKTFRLRETQISMQVVFPFAVIHSSLYVLSCVIIAVAGYSVIGTEIEIAEPIIQCLTATKGIYLTGVPLLLLLFRIRQSKQTDEWLAKRDHAEIYFQQFKNQIK